VKPLRPMPPAQRKGAGRASLRLGTHGPSPAQACLHHRPRVHAPRCPDQPPQRTPCTSCVHGAPRNQSRCQYTPAPQPATARRMAWSKPKRPSTAGAHTCTRDASRSACATRHAHALLPAMRCSMCRRNGSWWMLVGCCNQGCMCRACSSRAAASGGTTCGGQWGPPCHKSRLYRCLAAPCSA